MAVRALAFLTLLTSICGTASAQSSLDWIGTHSGNPLQTHGTKATCVAAFPEGGSVLGYTTWHYQFIYPNQVFTDVAADVIRWSEDGQKLWTVRPAGAKATHAIAVDPGGAIYVVTQGGPAQLHRIEPDGSVTWERVGVGGASQQVAVAPNGDVLAAGGQGNSIAVARWSSAGAPLWATTVTSVTGSAGGEATWLGVDGDGNALVAGVVFEAGSSARVAKLDAAGQVQWVHTGPGFGYPKPSGAIDAQGNVAFGASPGSSTASVTLLAPDGTLRWETSWTGGPLHGVHDVEFGSDGAVWAIGPSQPFLYVRRIGAGTVLSEDVYGAPDMYFALAAGLVRGDAGQMFAAATLRFDPSSGGSYNEIATLQYDADGGRNWVLSLDAYPSGFGEAVSSVARTTGNRLVMAGSSCEHCVQNIPGLVVAYDVSDAPDAYCEGKVNSLGCTPAMTFSGLSSTGATSGFTVAAHGELTDKLGLLLYSVTGPSSIPFQGGTLCVQSPLRTPAQSSGGTGACTGRYEVDMNAFARGLAGGNPHPALLVPGTSVWVQAWGRDPGFPPPDNTSLSNGLRYVVLP